MQKVGIFEKKNEDGSIEISSKRIVGFGSAICGIGIAIAGLALGAESATVIGVVTAILAYSGACFGFTLKS
jgi:hypothetical protein